MTKVTSLQEKEEGERERYARTSILNQAVPFILKGLEELFPSVDTRTVVKKNRGLVYVL